MPPSRPQRGRPETRHASSGSPAAPTRCMMASPIPLRVAADMAGAIRFELRGNRHIAGALHRRDGVFPGPGRQRGATFRRGKDSRGRDCRSGSCVFVFRNEPQRGCAGNGTGSRRHRLEQPAPDRFEPRRRGICGTALSRRARHLQLRRRSRKDDAAVDYRWIGRGHVLAFGSVGDRGDRHVGGGHHLALAASGTNGTGARTERPQADKFRDRSSLLHRGFLLLLAIGVIDSATRMGFLTFLPFLLRGKRG